MEQKYKSKIESMIVGNKYPHRSIINNYIILLNKYIYHDNLSVNEGFDPKILYDILSTYDNKRKTKIPQTIKWDVWLNFITFLTDKYIEEYKDEGLKQIKNIINKLKNKRTDVIKESTEIIQLLSQLEPPPKHIISKSKRKSKRKSKQKSKKRSKRKSKSYKKLLYN